MTNDSATSVEIIKATLAEEASGEPLTRQGEKPISKDDNSWRALTIEAPGFLIVPR